jgi:hypothetical protein
MKNKMEKIEKQFTGITFDYAESIHPEKWFDINIDKTDLEKVLNEPLTKESMDLVEANMEKLDKFLETRHYDGFIGFSQGSVFARWYISLRKPSIKFFISIGSCDIQHDLYIVSKLPFPRELRLYNLYGTQDIYVPSKYSKLLTKFIGGKDIEFNGKHIIPKNEIIEILKDEYSI